MKKILRWISAVSTRTILYLFIASSLVCIFALRHNNQQMIKLREAVYQADKNNTDVNKALNNLRSYVYAHMNTNLSSGNNNIKPPIQLKYTYQRLYDNQFDAVQQANQKIYTDAQTYCQSVNNAFFGTTRVPCVQNYVVNHGVKEANITIPPGLYGFDFVSPRWSPDLAGWSLLVSLVSFIALLLKLGSNKIRVQK
jgi:hypothetical protein